MTELCCWFKAFNWLENSICCPPVHQVLRSTGAFFYQQMILSWFGRFFELGREQEYTPYWPIIVYARRMVRRGQSYAVDSKRSIDLKTQFVAHVSIGYSVLLRLSFINKWFRHGLDVSSSWGESRDTLLIDQWFCLLEGWSEEDRAMLSIQSVQSTWKLNLLPTCWSGTPFCQGILLSTNDFVIVWMFLQVGERAGIHSVLTNDFVC
jgi:hypothetical protein